MSSWKKVPHYILKELRAGNFEIATELAAMKLEPKMKESTDRFGFDFQFPDIIKLVDQVNREITNNLKLGKIPFLKLMEYYLSKFCNRLKDLKRVLFRRRNITDKYAHNQKDSSLRNNKEYELNQQLKRLDDLLSQKIKVKFKNKRHLMHHWQVIYQHKKKGVMVNETALHLKLNPGSVSRIRLEIHKMLREILDNNPGLSNDLRDLLDD